MTTTSHIDRFGLLRAASPRAAQHPRAVEVRVPSYSVSDSEPLTLLATLDGRTRTVATFRWLDENVALRLATTFNAIEDHVHAMTVLPYEPAMHTDKALAEVLNSMAALGATQEEVFVPPYLDEADGLMRGGGWSWSWMADLPASSAVKLVASSGSTYWAVREILSVVLAATKLLPDAEEAVRAELAAILSRYDGPTALMWMDEEPAVVNTGVDHFPATVGVVDELIADSNNQTAATALALPLIDDNGPMSDLGSRWDEGSLEVLLDAADIFPRLAVITRTGT